MPQFLSGEAACQPRPLGIAQIACAFSWNQRGGASYFCLRIRLPENRVHYSGRCSSASGEQVESLASEKMRQVDRLEHRIYPKSGIHFCVRCSSASGEQVESLASEKMRQVHRLEHRIYPKSGI